MRVLAAQVGMSDVGLKKLLRAYGVSPPPQGHWNRVHAGRRVDEPPRAVRGPGETPYIYVDGRFAHLPEAPIPSSQGPFVSAKVPEELEQLRAQEQAAIGRAASAARMTIIHPAIRLLIASDEKELARATENRWHTANLLYSSPYEKRRLRILNAVFLTLQRRGHDAGSSRTDDRTGFWVIIGDSRVEVALVEAGQKASSSRYCAGRPDPKRSASVKMSLIAGSGVWTDQDDAPLESKVAEISAGLIVEGERSYRQHLRRLEEQAEHERIEEERRRQERLRKANADRITALVESGRLLAEAENMRGLIARVASAVAAGQLDLTVEQLAEWRQWADEEADKLDPVLSGQVRKHLLPPRVE